MRRGWCPSLHEPMQSGDGLLLRVKPRLATLSADAARVLADAAACYGNGAVELTGRANLQFRGFSAAGARAFAEIAVDHGLASRDPAAERRRNVIVSPLTGPTARALATALEDMLEADDTLATLPGKFGLVVDCAGAPGDIRLRLRNGRVYLSLDGTDLEAPCALDAAVAAVRRLIGDGRERMRDRDAAATFAAAGLSSPLPWWVGRGVGFGRPHDMSAWRAAIIDDAGMDRATPPPAPPTRRGGKQAAQPASAAHPIGRVDGAFGLAVGQICAPALAALADIAQRDGDGTLRLTPWRVILLPGVTHIEAPPEGCIADPADPALAISACVGRPGCASASVDTRADAAILARAGLTQRIHLSGCAKGCAHPGPAPVTLVGHAGAYDLIRNGRAGDVPCRAGLTVAEAILALA